MAGDKNEIKIVFKEELFSIFMSLSLKQNPPFNLRRSAKIVRVIKRDRHHLLLLFIVAYVIVYAVLRA